MIISNFPSGGGKKLFAPQFTGKSKLVLLNGGKAGYMEFYTSGTLTWLDDKVPPSVDMFCVGGGGGGSGGVTDPNYYAGAGGGGGYTTTVLSAPLPPAVEITIGAGGAGSARNNSYMATNKGEDGGTTSIGDICVAAGGKGGRAAWNSPGGDGGSGGGTARENSSNAERKGGSNGADGGNGYLYAGKGQGTPTTDLLGRIHAGGGSGAGGSSFIPGGASDFEDGRGQNSMSQYGREAPTNNSGAGGGGGGFGGGGAGGGGAPSNQNGGNGGQGFAMIAWGDYSSAIVG
jgi:hypothetical protein